MRLLFLILCGILLLLGLVFVGLPLGAAVDAALHHESILKGKDPAFIFLMPIAGVFILKWARDSWRRWRGSPVA